ncbi:NAD(P)-dependent oxidoreductase [Chitinivorax sp. PXF-14]|uniref:NAD-dependent epimerase/dehydratase family protein n=1 Tax=Chitinivorax sp. PXF-14 TaxID=3230488 RepID=UPI0034666E99
MTERLHILLLGASGFVGRALLREFASMPAGSVRVRALLRAPDALPDYPFLDKVRGDLARPPLGLEPEQPYVLVHFAVKQIDHDGTGFIATNVDATRRLLRGLGPRLRGVIYGSSMSVYGQDEQDGISEIAAPNPGTALAHSRHLAERLVGNVARQREIPAYLLRPRFVLGEGDRFVLPSLARMVQKRVRIGSGRQRFSVIDVDDYACAISRLAQRIIAGAPGAVPKQEVLNVGYGQPVACADLLDELAAALDAPKAIWRLPVSRRLTLTLRRLPFSGSTALATRLELVGLPHWGEVDALGELVGRDLTSRDPLAAVRSAARALRQGRATPETKHTT